MAKTGGAGSGMDCLFEGLKDKASKGLSDAGKTVEGKSDEVKPLKVKVLREAIDAANSKKQRIAVWSPVVSATIWYLKTTAPLFSISDEAGCLIWKAWIENIPSFIRG